MPQAAVAALVAPRAWAPRPRARLERVQAAWLGEEMPRSPGGRGAPAPGAALAGGVPGRRGDALAGGPIPGRPRTADGADLAALETAVATPPRRRGVPVAGWRARRVRACLAEPPGLRVAPGWRERHRQRFGCGRPHPPWIPCGLTRLRADHGCHHRLARRCHPAATKAASIATAAIPLIQSPARRESGS